MEGEDLWGHFFFFFPKALVRAMLSSVLRMPSVPTQGPNFGIAVWLRASLQSLAAAGFQTCELSILTV